MVFQYYYPSSLQVIFWPKSCKISWCDCSVTQSFCVELIIDIKLIFWIPCKHCIWVFKIRIQTMISFSILSNFYFYIGLIARLCVFSWSIIVSCSLALNSSCHLFSQEIQSAVGLSSRIKGAGGVGKGWQQQGQTTGLPPPPGGQYKKKSHLLVVSLTFFCSWEL